MTIKYLSCAETAKLVRQSLKEAFPCVKFSVRSSTYSGGASIRVRWTDGPNTRQVDALLARFEGTYFDGSIDYKGSVHAMLDGQLVHFGADSISTSRDYSDAWVERAIDRVFARLRGNFADNALERPTVEDFRRGRLCRVKLSGLHHYGTESVQHEIHCALSKHTYSLKTQPSKTAGRAFVTHDDGYSRSNGSGQSVVPTDL